MGFCKEHPRRTSCFYKDFLSCTVIALETQKCRNYAFQKSSCTTLLKSVVTILLKSVLGASAYAALWSSYTFEKCSTNCAIQKYSYYTFVFPVRWQRYLEVEGGWNKNDMFSGNHWFLKILIPRQLVGSLGTINDYYIFLYLNTHLHPSITISNRLLFTHGIVYTI